MSLSNYQSDPSQDQLDEESENLQRLGFGTDEDESEEKQNEFDLEEEPDLSGPVLPRPSDNPFGVQLNEEEEEELVEKIVEEIAANQDEDDDLVDNENEQELIEDVDDEENIEEESNIIDCEDGALISKSKIIVARQLLQNIRSSSEKLHNLLGSLLDDGDEERINLAEISEALEGEDEDGRIIEGVFNGENMIGPDGKEYAVPANYASKSKLVEGDMLKLSITDRGTFIYKQTKPVERKRMIGKLEKDINGNYLVQCEHKKYHVITASITYYKGNAGDKVVILVPVAGDSAWAAVENVIKTK